MAERLRKFYLPGLEEVGTDLGEGSWAVVVEFQLYGLKCAGKKLQRQLCFSNPEEREGLVSRFEEECRLLSEIRHPNIVQFLGLSHNKDTNTPILVMECLDTTLTACITLHGVLPDEFNYSILNDIATALCYLHNQPRPIVHRDLTPNNVLLTADMKAKISDLGVAKILNFSFSKRIQMTTCPGTISYMPPEALAHNSVYDCSIDIFAVGVMVLHIFCAEWPIPGEPNRVDPQNPVNLLPVTEVERRAAFISKLRPKHPLLSLIQKCLSNYPPHRPTASQVLAETRAQYHPTSPNKLQMLKELQEMSAENTMKKDTTKEDSKALDTLTREKESLEQLLNIKDDTLAARGKQIIAMREQLLALQEEVAAHEREISVKDGLLVERQASGIENVPLGLHLRRCKDFPHKDIVGNPNCTVFKNTLYVGAGHCRRNNSDGHLVYYYNEVSDSWNQLPPAPHRLFGLGHLDNGIVAVGGLAPYNATREVYTFIESEQVWKKTIPEMPTARCRLTVVSHSQGIVACGGLEAMYSQVSGRVEVFVLSTSCWHIASSLTVPCAITKPMIIGEQCYLVGGYSKWRPSCPTRTIQYISLSNLFSGSTTENFWKLMPETPYDRPVPISIAGALVVIGGWDEGPHDDIFVYSEKSNGWNRIGKWPTPFRSGGSATLPSGESIVIGGIDFVDTQHKFQVGLVTLKSQ